MDWDTLEAYLNVIGQEIYNAQQLDNVPESVSLSIMGIQNALQLCWSVVEIAQQKEEV